MQREPGNARVNVSDLVRRIVGEAGPTKADAQDRAPLHALRYRRVTCPREFPQPLGLRHVRHQDTPCPHGAQSEDRRDPGDLRLQRDDRARQAVGGFRQRGLLAMAMTGDRGQEGTEGAAC